MSNCRCHFDALEFEYEDRFYSIECTAYGTYSYDPWSRKKFFHDLHGGRQSDVAEWLDYPELERRTVNE